MIAWILLSWAPAARAQDGIAALRPAIEARFPEVSWIDGATLQRWLREPRPVVLLDARAADEFRVSHLEGAVRVDPDAPDLSRIRPPAGARVVVYCSVGWRSASVADVLRRHGLADVYNLEGGIFRWANGGGRVVRDGAPVRAVHPFDATWGLLLREPLRAYRP